MGRVLVTGGAGFIGSHICDRILEMGHEVVCFDNLVTGFKENIEHLIDKDGFSFVNGDIRDAESVREHLAGCTHVCHQAALGSVHQRDGAGALGGFDAEGSFRLAA